jgi:hypothetical protein
MNVLLKLLEDNRDSVPTIFFHHDESDMRFTLRPPFVSIGSDDYAFATEGSTWPIGHRPEKTYRCAPGHILGMVPASRSRVGPFPLARTSPNSVRRSLGPFVNLKSLDLNETPSRE